MAVAPISFFLNCFFFNVEYIFREPKYTNLNFALRNALLPINPSDKRKYYTIYIYLTFLFFANRTSF